MESLIEGDLSSKYSWEKNVSSSWENVQEDSEGNITLSLSSLTDRDRLYHRNAKSRRITTSVRRGLIRYLVLGIDCSLASLEKDFRPNRLEVIKVCLSKFIRYYFDQNPISQLCLSITRDRIAEKLTELSGNPKYHESKLINDHSTSKGYGDASLQNLIYLSMNILKNIPQYGNREVLIVYNSLKTRDPGNIFDTIVEAKKLKIRISIISLSAELYICKKIAQETGGSYQVAMDVNHLDYLLAQHISPVPETTATTTTSSTSTSTSAYFTTDFIYMGFPTRILSSQPSIGYDGNQMKILSHSACYICPRCLTKVSELPTQCNVCRLQLTSSSHIARSHHHLFPIPNFIEVDLLNDCSTNNISSSSSSSNGSSSNNDSSSSSSSSSNGSSSSNSSSSSSNSNNNSSSSSSSSSLAMNIDNNVHSHNKRSIGYDSSNSSSINNDNSGSSSSYNNNSNSSSASNSNGTTSTSTNIGKDDKNGIDIHPSYYCAGCMEPFHTYHQSSSITSTTDTITPPPTTTTTTATTTQTNTSHSLIKTTANDCASVTTAAAAVVASGSNFALKCPSCLNLFCMECDLFIHDSLHNCPGCGT